MEHFITIMTIPVEQDQFITLDLSILWKGLAKEITTKDDQV